MPRRRRVLAAALATASVTAAATASLAAVAPAGLAGTGDRTDRAFTLTASGGSVATSIVTDASDASPMGLHDYTDPGQADVAYATPAAGETLTVTVQRKSGAEVLTCRTGLTHYYAGFFVGGNSGDWMNLPDGGTTKVRVRLNCTTADDTVHHLHWAEHRLSSTKWLSPAPTAGCVTLARQGDVFTLTAKGCVVQDEVVAWKPSRQLSTSDVTADFTATLVRGAVLSR